MQNIEYEAQLKQKKEKLRALLSRVAGLELPDIEIVASEPYGYRDRFQFHRVDKTLGTKSTARYKPLAIERVVASSVGFAALRSNDIIPINDCLVANKLVRRALREGKIKAPLDKDRWTVYGRGETLLEEGGRARGKIMLCGKELLVDAALFFQSNGALLEKLIERIMLLAGNAEKKSRAGDFYCGVGTFAVFLQDFFPHLDLLEENTASLSLARDNLAHTSSPSAAPRGKNNFWAETDNQWVKKAQRKNEPYNFLVVDPSRQGLSASMRKWLCEHKPHILIYVSCDPTALARDTRELAASFTLESLTLYDFYPQTEHIETLAVFKIH
jgi:23S rRNA (uracil1939-C5)-methyltransferase